MKQWQIGTIKLLAILAYSTLLLIVLPKGETLTYVALCVFWAGSVYLWKPRKWSPFLKENKKESN